MLQPDGYDSQVHIRFEIIPRRSPPRMARPNTRSIAPAVARPTPQAYRFQSYIVDSSLRFHPAEGTRMSSFAVRFGLFVCLCAGIASTALADDGDDQFAQAANQY